jgi:hypothetical protein
MVLMTAQVPTEIVEALAVHVRFAAFRLQILLPPSTGDITLLTSRIRAAAAAGRSSALELGPAPERSEGVSIGMANECTVQAGSWMCSTSAQTRTQNQPVRLSQIVKISALQTSTNSLEDCRAARRPTATRGAIQASYWNGAG